MRLKRNEVVCFMCRKIIPLKDAKDAVAGVEWGSCNSGKPDYDYCCKKHKTDKDGFVKGLSYA